VQEQDAARAGASREILPSRAGVLEPLRRVGVAKALKPFSWSMHGVFWHFNHMSFSDQGPNARIHGAFRGQSP
jgi:hypothetical protein